MAKTQLAPNTERKRRNTVHFTKANSFKVGKSNNPILNTNE